MVPVPAPIAFTTVRAAAINPVEVSALAEPRLPFAVAVVAPVPAPTRPGVELRTKSAAWPTERSVSRLHKRGSVSGDGWGGRDRTSEWRNQNPLPYRLATPHRGT